MQLPIRIDQSLTNVAALLAAGRRHRLTAHDAAYLLLAERIGAPLATLDSNLIAATRTAGVELAMAD